MNSSKIYKDINFIETLELNSLNGIMGGVSVGLDNDDNIAQVSNFGLLNSPNDVPPFDNCSESDFVGWLTIPPRCKWWD